MSTLTLFEAYVAAQKRRQEASMHFRHAHRTDELVSWYQQHLRYSRLAASLEWRITERLAQAPLERKIVVNASDFLPSPRRRPDGTNSFPGYGGAFD